MTETKQTIQFNSANPYLNPIMEVFNSNEKGKKITVDNFGKHQIQLADGVKQDKFYKKLNEFIKEAKKVANSEKPKDKDIENLQKKKKEIVGMVKSNYDKLLQTILETIDNNNLETQAGEIKNRINEDNSINEIDKYNLITLIDEAVELKKVSNELSNEGEYNKKVKDKIGKNKNEILKFVESDSKKQSFIDALDSFIKEVSNNEMLVYIINDEIGEINNKINVKINDDKSLRELINIKEIEKISDASSIDSRIIDKTINNKIREIENLKKTLEEKSQEYELNENVKKKIDVAIRKINEILQSNTNRQKDNNIIKEKYTKLRRNVIMPKLSALKELEDSQKKEIREIINDTEILLVTPFKKAQEQQKNKKKQQKTKITQAINNYEKQKTQLELALDTPIACCFNISIQDSRTSSTKGFVNNFNKGLCPTTDKPKVEETLQQIQDFCDIVKQVINTDEFKEYVTNNPDGAYKVIEENLKNTLLNSTELIANSLGQKMGTISITFKSLLNFIGDVKDENKQTYINKSIEITTKLTELLKTACDIKNTQNKEESIKKIGEDINKIENELINLNTNQNKEIERRVNQQFTEIGTLITSTIPSNTEVTTKQKEQLIWNKIYIDRANPCVAQQQDCIKAIQDISKDNLETINETLIEEVIVNNLEKNYEGLIKIHGTDHNEAKNEIDIGNDTIMISEKNNVGDNVKLNKTISISNYILNERCEAKEDKKRINLLKTDDNRPTNELASLLKQISTLKTLQQEVYNNTTKQIAKLIKEKIITEQIKDGETIKNEFPNTSGGVVISALKNLYDTHLSITDAEEKAVGETFGDVMVQLRVLMGDEKYKSDFEEKVDGLIKNAKEKVKNRKKEEQKKKEQEEEETKKKNQKEDASKEVEKLVNDYNSFSNNFTVNNGGYIEQTTNIKNNLTKIEELKKQVGDVKTKFTQDEEFKDIVSINISITNGVKTESKTLTKVELNKKIKEYETELENIKKQQEEELKKIIQQQRETLLKKAEELKDKVAKQDVVNKEVEQLESDIDEYNEQVEKYDNILNSNETEEDKKVKQIDSNTDENYKNLLIAFKTLEYKTKKANEEKEQQEKEEERKKEEEAKKQEEEKKKKEEELKREVNKLRTIKYKITKQKEDGNNEEVVVEGEKDIIGTQQDIEAQIGEVGTYYSNYNPIISKLKEEDTIKTLDELGLSEGCSVAELIDVLDGFEKNVETLGSNTKYFDDEGNEDKRAKHNIFVAQQTVVENINTCFNRGIFVRSKDNIGKDSKKQTLENLIKQGQYVNSLVENAKICYTKKDTISTGNYNDCTDEQQDFVNNIDDKLDNEVKTNIVNATKDEENTVLKKITNNNVELKDKEENKESEVKQQTIENTENINIDEELKKLKDDTKKLNEELLTVDEIKEKANQIKEQHKAITKRLENPNEKITIENYNAENIEKTIKEAEELQTEIKNFTANDGVFKVFKNELGDDFDKSENDENGNPKSKLDTLLEDYVKKNDEIKKQVEQKKKENEEKKQKEQEEQKIKEIEEQAKKHTENKKKQKLIEEAEKDKQYIESNKDGIKSLKDNFDKKDEIKAEDLSKQNNEQQIRGNITAGEELLKRLNKFKKDNGEYKDILNENGVILGVNIEIGEFENAFNNYKDKYKEEKEKEIKGLLNKEKATDKDIGEVYSNFQEFETYCKKKEGFTDIITNLKKIIKTKKKELIIQKIPELLKTTTNEVTGKAQNNSKQLKTLINNFKKDFEGVDGIDNDIKEINGGIKEYIDNLLKINEQTQVVDETKLQEVYDVFKEFEEELKEQKQTIEKKFNEVQGGIFDKKVEQVVERNEQEEKTAKTELEKKIEEKAKEIEKLEVKDEESKKEAEEKLKKLEELSEKVDEFNKDKEEGRQIKTVKIEKTDEKGIKIEEEIGIEGLKVKTSKKILQKEKKEIEDKNNKINNEHGTRCEKYIKIRKGVKPSEQASLDEEKSKSLEEATKYLDTLMQLKKDADKHNEKTKDNEYEDVRLEGYNTTNDIPTTLNGYIKGVAEYGIFKTHEELFKNEITKITQRYNKSIENLNSVNLEKFEDSNLQDNVSKITDTMDSLKYFEALSKKIEEVNKLIKNYNELDKGNKEENLDGLKKEVEELKQKLEKSINDKLDEINKVIEDEVNKINDNKKLENKEKQQPIDYKKLKNACLAVVQILEDKFKDKDACDVLEEKEQKQYINACMQLGWLNTLMEKETALKSRSIESFKYYEKALRILNNNSYNDKKKEEHKNTIVRQLTEDKILEKAEKELEETKKSIKQNKDIIKTQISELKSDIKKITKTKDINEQAEQILKLKIIDLSNKIQEDIKTPKNENIENATPSQSTEVDINRESSPIPSQTTINSNSLNSISTSLSVPSGTVINNSSSKMPSIPPIPSAPPIPSVPPIPSAPSVPSLILKSSGNSVVNLKSVSGTVINNSSSKISSVVVPLNTSSTVPISLEGSKNVLMNVQSTIPTQNDKHVSESTNETIITDNNSSSKQNNNTIIQNGPKPAVENVSNINNNKQEAEQQNNQTQENNNKQEAEQQKKPTQQNEQKSGQINNQATSKQNTKQSSQIAMFCMMSMFIQVMEQNKKAQGLFMKNMFNSNSLYPFGSSIMPNNYFNNPLANNLFSSFNMWNNLNASLKAFNMFNNYGLYY